MGWACAMEGYGVHREKGAGDVNCLVGEREGG